jgi:putative restriction endonuclease
VTGVAERRHLVASHIKPWSKSNDDEKLDGCNGLLLSPHVDHLFDRGLISFSDTGHLLVSKTLKPSVLTAWGIDPSRNVGAFNAEQRRFLADHRARHGFSP